MPLKISPRNKLDNILAGTNCSQTLDISKKLKTDTVASYSYKIYDSSNNEVTDTFSGGSSISSNIITFGIKAIEAGTYTLEFIITCNEVLPDGITPREFYMTMTIQIMDTALVKPEKLFVFDVQTTGADETFSLPLEASGTYNFIVNWGDESSDDITAYDQAEITHTYASAGTYEIIITGTIIGWSFNDTGDITKIYEIKSWGSLRLGNSGGYFYGCSNLTVIATDILDLTGTTSLESLFDGCSSLTVVPSINSWDVSAVTVMSFIFYNVSSFNQDLSSWNTSSVTHTYGMFFGADSFNQDLSSWDMSSITDAQLMFYNALTFDQDLSSWDTSSLIFANRMFYGAISFNQDLGSWNISSLKYTAEMFFGVTLSTANYDALLIGWEAQAVQDNITFHGGNSKYSAGAAATARQALIDDHNWTITDGGQV